MGTVQYMSPEQLRELSVDARTDIWSLGVVLHEMVTGRTPFAAQNQNDSIALILARQPTPLALQADDMPLEFQQIVARAVCTEREARYQTVAELAADLKRTATPARVKSGLVTQIRPSADSEKGPDDLGQPLRLISTTTRFHRVKSQFAASTIHLLSEVKKRPEVSVFTGLTVLLALLFFPRAAAPSFPDDQHFASTNSGVQCARPSPRTDVSSRMHLSKTACRRCC